jgi:hypothetical protein
MVFLLELVTLSPRDLLPGSLVEADWPRGVCKCFRAYTGVRSHYGRGISSIESSNPVFSLSLFVIDFFLGDFFIGEGVCLAGVFFLLAD